MKNSFFQSKGHKNNKVLYFKDIIKGVQEGEWKESIDELRQTKANGDMDKASEIKDNLPCFTVSGVFEDGHAKVNLKEYNNIISLDYDNKVNPEELRDSFRELPYTYCAFISPSGNGVKVFIKTDNRPDDHEKAFKAIKKLYDTHIESESDSTVKNINRLCFVSYDAALYLNEDSEIYSYVIDYTTHDYIWNSISSRDGFVKGNRNNYVFSFACESNRQGVDLQSAIDYACQFEQSDFTNREIKSIIIGAYNRYRHQSGINVNVAKLAISTTDDGVVYQTPYISDFVYRNLPPILKEACSYFEGRQRDVFLTSSLCVLSGGLHNVYGLYDRKKVYPNLYSCVVAPPASGKGCMKYGKMLGNCYHESLLLAYDEALKQYNKDKHIYESQMKKGRIDVDAEDLKEPQKPKVNAFFIPGNSSSSAMVDFLSANKGIGLMCESEVDTLTNALKQEWGGFSDTLRLGFHGETISINRKTNSEYIEVKEPKFAIAMTGTPNQLDPLFRGVEDGLFSRFMFYTFKAEPKWRSTFTDGSEVSLEDIFAHYSVEFCDKFKNKKVQKFSMTRAQHEELDKTFSKILLEIKGLYSFDVVGVIFRLGVICYKIAMILSSLRSNDDKITCNDLDFHIALELVTQVYFPHCQVMLEELGKKTKALSLNDRELLDWINSNGDVKRAELEVKANSLGIPSRTLNNRLKKFIDLGALVKVKHGVYRGKA